MNIDEFDAAAHLWVGISSFFLTRFDVALASTERAVELNPNFAVARSFRGLVYGFTGHPEEGIEEAELALRISPRDWYRFLFLLQLACCHYVARDYIAAIKAATKAVALRPDYFFVHQLLARSCTHAPRFWTPSASTRTLISPSPKRPCRTWTRPIWNMSLKACVALFVRRTTFLANLNAIDSPPPRHARQRVLVDRNYFVLGCVIDP